MALRVLMRGRQEVGAGEGDVMREAGQREAGLTSGAHKPTGRPGPAQEQYKADCVSGKGKGHPGLKSR